MKETCGILGGWRLGAAFAVLFGLLLPVEAQAFEGIGWSGSAQHSGPEGSISGDVQARVQVQVEAAETGAGGTLDVLVGVRSQLNAESAKARLGNEHASISAKVDAQVEALLGAAGKVNAHIDENGITIGAEGRAGAFVRGEVGLTLTTEVFGIETKIRGFVEGYAGVGVQGKASVTIGFDGQVEFTVAGGAGVKLGAGVGVQFSLDASGLITQLGLRDMTALVEWLAEFADDPWRYLERVSTDALALMGQQAVNKIGKVIDTITSGKLRLAWNRIEEIRAAMEELENMAGPPWDRFETGVAYGAASYRGTVVPSRTYQSPAWAAPGPYVWPAPYAWPSPIRW